MVKRGRYIVWEGSDGIGKGTQMTIALQESERRGIPTLAVREPGGSEFGGDARRILLEPKDYDLNPRAETALFLADRVQMWYSIINPALDRGYDVHSDRNWWSTVAYQGTGGELSAEFVVAAHRHFLPEAYLKPDLGFVFQLSEQERKMRKKSASLAEFGTLDRIEQKGDRYFGNVEQGYEYVCRELGGIGVDAAGTPDEVSARWWDRVFPKAS